MRSINERNRLESDLGQVEVELKRAEDDASKREEIEATLKSKTKEMGIARRAKEDAGNESVFLSFAVDAFGKGGVPAALMAEACPVLNAAADYYSDLICDGQISVAFRLEGDDIAVSVSNRWGGEGVDDQSCGETRTASLIVSLALRETSAPCNLLIADEPGDGLDELGAARLAQSLAEVADRFGCLYVISHNPNILAELEDYPQIVVEKSSGISKVL
jgi:DNA repair exonuclease SbcCD ATPase subunit